MVEKSSSGSYSGYSTVGQGPSEPTLPLQPLGVTRRGSDRHGPVDFAPRNCRDLNSSQLTNNSPAEQPASLVQVTHTDKRGCPCSGGAATKTAGIVETAAAEAKH